MSKTKLFGLLTLGASAIGLVGTTVKLIQKNSELKDLITDYEYLDDLKNETIAERDRTEEELRECQSELEDVRGDMLEYMAECDKLKKQVDMLNYALKTERSLKN